MWLIDTNIIIYAVGKSHPHQKACREVTEKAVVNPEQYNINTETFQEILHVYHSRKETEKGIILIDRLLKIFPHPILITAHDLKIGGLLLKKNKSISVRDALHAAVVKNNHMDGIITFDRHFSHIKDITVKKPIE